MALGTVCRDSCLEMMEAPEKGGGKEQDHGGGGGGRIAVKFCLPGRLCSESRRNGNDKRPQQINKRKQIKLRMWGRVVVVVAEGGGSFREERAVIGPLRS